MSIISGQQSLPVIREEDLINIIRNELDFQRKLLKETERSSHRMNTVIDEIHCGSTGPYEEIAKMSFGEKMKHIEEFYELEASEIMIVARLI